MSGAQQHDCICVLSLPRRLLELCQAALMNALLGMPLKQAANEAPHLLCVAEELGLSQLCRSAAAFIAHNLEECRVRTNSAWCCKQATSYSLTTRRCMCCALGAGGRRLAVS